MVYITVVCVWCVSLDFAHVNIQVHFSHNTTYSWNFLHYMRFYKSDSRIQFSLESVNWVGESAWGEWNNNITINWIHRIFTQIQVGHIHRYNLSRLSRACDKKVQLPDFVPTLQLPMGNKHNIDYRWGLLENNTKVWVRAYILYWVNP